jgi:hypothetical protein
MTQSCQIKQRYTIGRYWMIYRKHPIRSLLTSILRKANIRYPICNIDRDWMIYRKHLIRSLLTSILRKANIRYPSDVYAHSERTCTLLTIMQSCTLTIHFCLWEIPRNYFPLYFSKERVYIRGAPNVCLSKNLCQKRSDWMFTINHPIAVHITNKCGLRNNTCVFTRFHSVKNANTQLIWTPDSH